MVLWGNSLLKTKVLWTELVITVEVKVAGMLKAMQMVKNVLIGFQWGVRTPTNENNLGRRNPIE